MAGMAIAMIVDAKRGILARVQIRSFQPTDRPNCEHLNMSGRVRKIGLSWNTTSRKQPSSRDCDSLSHRLLPDGHVCISNLTSMKNSIQYI